MCFKMNARQEQITVLETQLDTLRKELAEVKAERDEIITVAHNRGIKDELEIDALKAERDRLRDALEKIAGKKQCVDNLLSDKEIAHIALEIK